MARRLVFTREAKADARVAYDWDEAQVPGLGAESLLCLKSACRQIADAPQRLPIRFDNFRRSLLRRFPYAIYFDFDETTVVI